MGPEDFAVLVQGEDRFGHFELVGPPKGVLHPDDLALARRVNAIEDGYFYAGAGARGRRSGAAEPG